MRRDMTYDNQIPTNNLSTLEDYTLNPLTCLFESHDLTSPSNISTKFLDPLQSHLCSSRSFSPTANGVSIPLSPLQWTSRDIRWDSSFQ